MTVPGLAGILLTGGASRRLGVDKACVAYHGETLAVRGARLLGSVCGGPVLEVGDGHSGLRSVREEPVGAGPLAALAAAGTELRVLGHDGGALLLAVDMPAVDERLLRFLAEWRGAPTAIPEAGGRLQPVCARYGGDALLAARSLAVVGMRPFRDLLAVVEHDVIPEQVWSAVAHPDAFVDVDTPTDAERFGITLRVERRSPETGT